MLNPAVTGTQEGPVLSMTFRSQWTGIEGAPETQAVSFGTPINNERIGLGISVVNDRTFVEKQTQIFANFSYRLQLNNNSTLYLGLNAGGNSFRVNAQGLEYYGTAVNDPNLIDFSRFNPNVGAGTYVKHPRYYVSLSAPKLLNTQRYKSENGLVTTASDKIHVYGSAGTYIDLSDRWQFIPSFITRYVANAPLLLTLNGSFSYANAIDLGFEYNFESGMGGTFMLNTSDTFSFGYAYVTSQHKNINQFSYGTHEAVVKIRLNENANSGSSKDRREPITGLRNNRNN
jgi:type IX secretion system PorP/SprF family membrane protein